MNAIAGAGELIRKAYFPRWILVVASTTSALLTFAINTVLVVVVTLLLGTAPSFPEEPARTGRYYIELAALVLGLSLLLSALFVFFRDLGHIWEILSLVLFYGSAVRVSVHHGSRTTREARGHRGPESDRPDRCRTCVTRSSPTFRRFHRWRTIIGPLVIVPILVTVAGARRRLHGLPQAHAALRRIAVKPVVDVSNLTKRFRLPLDKSTTLKYRVTHWRSASRYRDLNALRDVSFDIPEGQFLGHHRTERLRQEHVAEDHVPHLRADPRQRGRHGDFSAFLELGVGLQPGADRAREHLPRRRDARADARATARQGRRGARLRRARPISRSRSSRTSRPACRFASRSRSRSSRRRTS